MNKHTPGEWKVDVSFPHIIHAGFRDNGSFIERVMVCNVVRTPGSPEWGISKDNQLANARLIAAAPELLAALESLYETIRNYEIDMDTYPHHNMMEEARAAIAKAKGES